MVTPTGILGAVTSPDEPAPWLSSTELAAWMSLVAMLMTVPPAIDAQLKRDAGLNFFEYSILAGLSREPCGRMRMSSLALLTGGSLSRLSHAVARLEQNGLVRRRSGGPQPGAAFTRCTEAFLTEQGRAALVAAAPAHVREARRLVFDELTATQVRQLQRICRQVVQSASPETGALLDAEITEEKLNAEIADEKLDGEITDEKPGSEITDENDAAACPGAPPGAHPPGAHPPGPAPGAC
jgi:DNA-binding MarR family transcriptional regulator